MDSLKDVLESAGLPAQRAVFTGKSKPKAYYTFLRLLRGAAVNADDKESDGRELYRVTLFHKGDFEAQLNKTLEVLREAGYYINSVDTESYETDTGYWLIPINVEILKE
jgi:hypothetical protein